MVDRSIFDLIREDNSLEKISRLKEIKLDEVNDEGQTALHLAVLNNKLEIVAFLLQLGMNPNQKDNNQLSPLIAAAANGLEEIFQVLLTYKPDLSQVNRFGGTALLPSSEKGYLKVVQKAIDAGVPVNHQNRLGWTALLEAVILGNEGFLFRDIIEELVSHQADIMIKDFDGLSAMDYLEKRNSHVLLPCLKKESRKTRFIEIKRLIRNNNNYEALKQLLEMEESSEQLYYLGFTYELLGNEEAAFYYYEKGYELDNQFAYYLGNLAKKLGESQLAISYFEKGGSVSQDKEFYNYHLSNYFRELGRHQEAIIIMDDLLKNDSNRVDYLFHKANSLRSLGRHQEAYDSMILANTIQPSNLLFMEHAKESRSKMI